MPSLEEYFKKTQYQAKYKIGDRVEGKWNGITFVGSVGNYVRWHGDNCKMKKDKNG